MSQNSTLPDMKYLQGFFESIDLTSGMESFYAIFQTEAKSKYVAIVSGNECFLSLFPLHLELTCRCLTKPLVIQAFFIMSPYQGWIRCNMKVSHIPHSIEDLISFSKIQ